MHTCLPFAVTFCTLSLAWTRAPVLLRLPRRFGDIRYGDTDVMRSHFVAKLSLGLNDNKKPAYELDVVFDTSSGNVILPSVSCTGLPCKQRNLYDPVLTGAEVVTETPIGSR